MHYLYYIIKSMRPRQWIKNAFVLIPLIFGQKFSDYPSILLSLEAVAIFCLLSGAVYLINDVIDLSADRKHPVKRQRPIAAGLISPGFAIATAILILSLSLISGLFMGKGFLIVLVVYLTIQIAYIFFLKEKVILDIFCISSGFFLRVIAGAVAIHVDISQWLIICTISISMFLSLAKRRNELTLLGVEDAENHRKVLSDYSPYLLDQMIGIITATTLLSYMLYCISPQVIAEFGTDQLIYTFPFVLYGIFRYLFLIHAKGKGGSPEEVLFTDLPLLISVALWGFCCIFIIYRAKAFG